MERTYAALAEQTSFVQDHITAGVSEEVTFDLLRLARDACSPHDFRSSHEEAIATRCDDILDKNAHVVSSSFRGTAPTPESMYERTLGVCAETMDLCDAPTDAPPAASNKCEACLAVVQDVMDVLGRGRGTATYLSKKHVWGVLDDVCASLPLRHPSDGGWAAAMQHVCDDILDTVEDDVAEALLDGRSPARAACGSDGLALCKGRKGDWTAAWRSPFHARPKYEQHDEL